MMRNTTTRGLRSRAVGAAVGGVTIFAMSACGSATELGAEQLIESQTGGDVDLDLDGDGSFSVETEDGSMTVDEDGNFVVTDENGEVVTGNVDVDGDGDGGAVNIESEDGDFQFETGGGIPEEWPSEVPAPEGMDDATSSVTEADGSLAITVTGAADPDLIATYGAALESAGFERTASFESPGNSSNTYENGTWNVAVSVFGEGDDAQGTVTLYSE